MVGQSYPPTLSQSASTTSVSSLKSIIRTPTGTIIRRTNSTVSTPGSNVIVPESTIFSSWTEVFERYPPPQVRVVAFQIRNEAQEKREQLRSLVGESYRDLLATADTIIGMDETVSEMENRFRNLATGCSSNAVRSRAKKLESFDKANQERVSKTQKTLAYVKIANDLLFAAESLLRLPSSIVTVAKLLVIAREIINLDEVKNSSKFGFVSSQLEALKTRYLASVSTIIRGTSTQNTLDALVSYSLFWSSTPAATLAYFVETRLAQLNDLFSVATNDSVVTALRALEFTISVTRSLFPSQFSRALARTLTFPILRDSEINKLSSLDTEMIHAWCPQKILEYTISVPKDSSEAPIDVDETLRSLQITVVSSFHSALKSIIEKISQETTPISSETQIQALINLRRTVFETLVEHPHLRPIILSEESEWESEWFPAFQSLCGRHLTIVENIALSLSELVKETATRTSTTSPQDPKGLWDDAWMNLDISRGALEFRTAISVLLSGNNVLCGDILKQIKAWWDGVQMVRGLLGKVKTVYDYESFGDAEDDWIKKLKSDAEREGSELEHYILDEIVPRGVMVLSNKIKEQLAEVTEDQVTAGLLARVARSIAELPYSQDSVKATASTLVDDVYCAFAEVIFPVNVNEEDIAYYFTSSVPTVLWEEEPDSIKYPFDASPWLSSAVYESYIKPILDEACEDIFLSFPLGASVCRRVVGQKWAAQLLDAVTAYLRSSTIPTEPKDETPMPVVVENEAVDGSLEQSPNAREEQDVESSATGGQNSGTMPEASASAMTSENSQHLDSDEKNLEPTPAPVKLPSREHWIQFLFDVKYLERIFSLDLSSLQTLICDNIDQSDDKLIDIVSKRVGSCWSRTYLLYAIL